MQTLGTQRSVKQHVPAQNPRFAKKTKNVVTPCTAFSENEARHRIPAAPAFVHGHGTSATSLHRRGTQTISSRRRRAQRANTCILQQSVRLLNAARIPLPTRRRWKRKLPRRPSKVNDLNVRVTSLKPVVRMQQHSSGTTQTKRQPRGRGVCAMSVRAGSKYRAAEPCFRNC